MNKRTLIQGAYGSGIAPIIKKRSEHKAPILIIVPTYIRGKNLAADISFFMSNKKVHLLEEEDPLFMGFQARSNEKQNLFIAALRSLAAPESAADAVIIVPLSAAMKRLPPAEIFISSILKVSVGEYFSPHELIRKLTDLHYERTANVEAPGQFALRGGILDVFVPGDEDPIRIEFFGDEIETIRRYDPFTQRSVREVSTACLCSLSLLLGDEHDMNKKGERLLGAYESHINMLTDEIASEDEIVKTEDESRIARLQQRMGLLNDALFNAVNLGILDEYICHFYKHTEFIWDYVNPSGAVFVYDPERIKEMLAAKEQEDEKSFESLLHRGYVQPGDFKAYSNSHDFEKLFRSVSDRNRPDITTFQIFDRSVDLIFSDEKEEIKTAQTPEYHGDFEFFKKDLKRLVKENYEVHIVCSVHEKCEGVRELISEAGLDSRVHIEIGILSEGFEIPREKIIYIWEDDIFIKKHRRKRSRREASGQVIKSVADISAGDYVIHEDHGIGIYSGIEELTVEGITREYIKVQYAGADLLYVPVNQMDIVQKYIGSASAPKINKLSGTEWKTTKEKTKAAIAEMANELLTVSARREEYGGYAFSKDTIWQKEFEDTFPYEETEDQLRSIEEIKSDMERSKPMDRLLCGDVGYGKTEVAARAIFKCLVDGKQAGILVPTTILASQHYSTLKERFENFPFRVEMLSRFKTAKEQRDILKKLESGEIDLIIGTHRILSGDVKFKDLGLLVVDEEQRFGVGDKEKIKKIKSNIDVLTLSATPIPRTLHMSLVGIRDMSVIEEPPEDRMPVQTYVFEEDDLIIRNAIERELSRGGQTYIVYNRVKGIRQMAERIEKLVPGARIALGHGQMRETDLEQVMLDFVEGQVDVLISTAIIESGIDIPNANTIIIMNADKFGLSQLYQLRGRVGRSVRTAYAYLFYKSESGLNEVSEKRLRAIRDFTEFGAGFKVAMKDLEIRGAGNVLGSEQSGHMVNVGYELYCKMVDSAIRALSGEIVRDERTDVPVDISVSAYIPNEYIKDEILKLQIYKKIAEIKDAGDAEDLRGELCDRFGEIPESVENLISIAFIRKKASALKISAIKQEGSHVLFKCSGGRVDRRISAELAAVYRRRVSLHPGVKPFFKFRYDEEAGALPEILNFLRIMEKGSSVW